MTIEPRSVTAFIGPVRLRQVDLPAHPQPHARGHPGRAGRGQGPARRRGHLRRRRSTRSTCAGRSAWSSSGRTRSRRCRSTTTSSPGLRLQRPSSKSELDDVVETLAAGREPLERGQGPAATSPARGCPAVSSSACASPGRSPSQPQVLLMDEPCSALDPISTLAIEDLIGKLKATYTIVIVTHNMQQAARVSRPHRLLQPRRPGQARPADRDGRHPEDLLQPQRASAPRTTSPAASADPTARPPCLGRRLRVWPIETGSRVTFAGRGTRFDGHSKSTPSWLGLSTAEGR